MAATTPDTCPKCGKSDATGVERYVWSDDAGDVEVQFRCWLRECDQRWSRVYHVVEEAS